MNGLFRILAVGCCLVGGLSAARADEKNGRLDIYFIDVEGGASTLIVTPKGESILIDSGYPEAQNRDRDRILKVVRDVAHLNHIDHAVVTHWHLDHYGNHAALAAVIPIKKFWDRGIPDAVQEDKQFHERIAAYRGASQNQSQTLRAGDEIELETDGTPLVIKILAASRENVPNTGAPNPFAAANEEGKVDNSDNAASVVSRLEFGKFRFLCCGDLTWNAEAALVTPNNPIGKIDLFMVTHHGLPASNNPTLVKAIDPIVAVMCNGPTKGGHRKTIQTLRSCPSLAALFQLHRNTALTAEEQAPAEFIANSGTTEDCQGVWIKASVAPGGGSFTVQIGPEGEPRTFIARGDRK
ncbi:ComEC/Rec2 family competence protein [Planctomicrobium sp. SH664]|uniref:ComEC/Rec2 family competence protein n=1 Tax=Planctomicrobium sp. SH664 TaxID=3448125 RepID=UPI003F5C9D4E